jgi:hypothetical chaperone protein
MSKPHSPDNFCAIDFGTSNSAMAVCIDDMPVLVPLEGTATNLPTALFYPADLSEDTKIGREAVAAYMEFEDGRLLRSIKSVLGSSLMQAATEVGPGRALNFTDIISEFIARIKHRAEKHSGLKLTRALIGRPAFFVDGDAENDALAQEALKDAALEAGFNEVVFEFEPVAAALTFSGDVALNQAVLVADIGGGTSDFSIIYVNEEGSRILANHGVHVAGTDFDRRVALRKIMPLLGFGENNPNGKPVPSSIYYDLSTWHLVNSLYSQKSKASLFSHRDMYGSKRYFDRLYRVLQEKLGHQLLAQAELAKIHAQAAVPFTVHLSDVEANLVSVVSVADVADAIASELASVAKAALQTVAQAGLTPDQIGALYFTGGSSGLSSLREAIAKIVPNAKTIEGERFESVVFGLGIAAIDRWSA